MRHVCQSLTASLLLLISVLAWLEGQSKHIDDFKDVDAIKEMQRRTHRLKSLQGEPYGHGKGFVKNEIYIPLVVGPLL